MSVMCDFAKNHSFLQYLLLLHMASSCKNTSNSITFRPNLFLSTAALQNPARTNTRKRKFLLWR
jgi:hypothetical protein